MLAGRDPRQAAPEARNLTTAFRQLDNSGDSRVCFAEYMQLFPKLMGEPISEAKMKELWMAMDCDMTGEVDLNEFASNKISSDTMHNQGVALLKDQAVTIDALASGHTLDHQKGSNPLFGVSNTSTSKNIKPPPKRSSISSEHAKELQASEKKEGKEKEKGVVAQDSVVKPSDSTVSLAAASTAASATPSPESPEKSKPDGPPAGEEPE